MPPIESDPRVEQKQLPCGCAVVLAVQQQAPCRHNAGQYPRGELDLEQVPCGCDEDTACDRCNEHRFVFKHRHHC